MVVPLSANYPMDHAARLLVGSAICLAVGWAQYGCGAARQVSPTTRDAAVKLAFDEFRYQCVQNPPSDARLQAACLVALQSDGAADAGSVPEPDRPNETQRPGTIPGESAPSPTHPGDAGASFDPTPGNAVRYVER